MLGHGLTKHGSVWTKTQKMGRNLTRFPWSVVSFFPKHQRKCDLGKGCRDVSDVNRLTDLIMIKGWGTSHGFKRVVVLPPPKRKTLSHHLPTGHFNWRVKTFNLLCAKQAFYLWTHASATEQGWSRTNVCLNFANADLYMYRCQFGNNCY